MGLTTVFLPPADKFTQTFQYDKYNSFLASLYIHNGKAIQSLSAESTEEIHAEITEVKISTKTASCRAYDLPQSH